MADQLHTAPRRISHVLDEVNFHIAYGVSGSSDSGSLSDNVDNKTGSCLSTLILCMNFVKRMREQRQSTNFVANPVPEWRPSFPDYRGQVSAQHTC